jgi:hypothetical protein
MQPIFGQDQSGHQKSPELQNFDYVFDTVAGNIVYSQPPVRWI